MSNSCDNSEDLDVDSGILDPNKEEILKPENNLPENRSSKDNVPYEAPPEREGKRYRPLGSFAHNPGKVLEDIPLPQEQNLKNAAEIYQPISKTGKDEAEPAFPDSHLNKDGDFIVQPEDSEEKISVTIESVDTRPNKNTSEVRIGETPSSKELTGIATPESTQKDIQSLDLSTRPEIKVGDTIIPASTRQAKGSAVEIGNTRKKKGDTSVPETNNRVDKKGLEAAVDSDNRWIKTDAIVSAETESKSIKIDNENTIDAQVAFLSPKELEAFFVPDDKSTKDEKEVNPSVEFNVKSEVEFDSTEASSKSEQEVDAIKQQNQKDEVELDSASSTEKDEVELSEAKKGDIKNEEPIEETTSTKKSEVELGDTSSEKKDELELSNVEENTSKGEKEISDESNREEKNFDELGPFLQQNEKGLQEISEDSNREEKPNTNEIDTTASSTVGKDSIPVSDSEASQKTDYQYDIQTPMSGQINENNYNTAEPVRNKDIADADMAQNTADQIDAGKNIDFTDEDGNINDTTRKIKDSSSQVTAESGAGFPLGTSDGIIDETLTNSKTKEYDDDVFNVEYRTENNANTNYKYHDKNNDFDVIQSDLDVNQAVESNIGNFDKTTPRKDVAENAPSNVGATGSAPDQYNERFDYDSTIESNDNRIIKGTGEGKGALDTVVGSYTATDKDTNKELYPNDPVSLSKSGNRVNQENAEIVNENWKYDDSDSDSDRDVYTAQKYEYDGQDVRISETSRNESVNESNAPGGIIQDRIEYANTEEYDGIKGGRNEDERLPVKGADEATIEVLDEDTRPEEQLFTNLNFDDDYDRYRKLSSNPDDERQNISAESFVSTDEARTHVFDGYDNQINTKDIDTTIRVDGNITYTPSDISKVDVKQSSTPADDGLVDTTFIDVNNEDNTNLIYPIDPTEAEEGFGGRTTVSYRSDEFESRVGAENLKTDSSTPDDAIKYIGDESDKNFNHQSEANFDYANQVTVSYGKPSAEPLVLGADDFRKPGEAKDVYAGASTSIPAVDVDSTEVRAALVENFTEAVVAKWEAQGTYIQNAQKALQEDASIITGTIIQETTNFSYGDYGTRDNKTDGSTNTNITHENFAKEVKNNKIPESNTDLVPQLSTVSYINSDETHDFGSIVVTTADSAVLNGQEVSNFNYDFTNIETYDWTHSGSRVAIKNSGFTAIQKRDDADISYEANTSNFSGVNTYDFNTFNGQVQTDFGANDFSFKLFEEVSVSRDIVADENLPNMWEQLGFNTLNSSGFTGAVSAVSNIVNNISQLTQMGGTFSGGFNLNNDYENVLRRFISTEIPSIGMTWKRDLDIQGSGGKVSGNIAETLFDTLGVTADLAETAGNILNHPGAAFANMIRGESGIADIFTGGSDEDINIFVQGDSGRHGGYSGLGSNTMDYDINDSWAMTTGQWNDESGSVITKKNTRIGDKRDPTFGYKLSGKDLIKVKARAGNFSATYDYKYFKNSSFSSLGPTTEAAWKSVASSYTGIIEDFANFDSTIANKVTANEFYNLTTFDNDGLATSPDNNRDRRITGTMRPRTIDDFDKDWVTISGQHANGDKRLLRGDIKEAMLGKNFIPEGSDNMTQAMHTYSNINRGVDSYKYARSPFMFDVEGGASQPIFQYIDAQKSEVDFSQVANITLPDATADFYNDIFVNNSYDSTYDYDQNATYGNIISSSNIYGSKVTYKDGISLENASTEQIDPHIIAVNTAGSVRLNSQSSEGKDRFYHYLVKKDEDNTDKNHFSWGQQTANDDNNIFVIQRKLASGEIKYDDVSQTERSHITAIIRDDDSVNKYYERLMLASTQIDTSEHYYSEFVDSVNKQLKDAHLGNFMVKYEGSGNSTEESHIYLEDQGKDLFAKKLTTDDFGKAQDIFSWAVIPGMSTDDENYYALLGDTKTGNNILANENKMFTSTEYHDPNKYKNSFITVKSTYRSKLKGYGSTITVTERSNKTEFDDFKFWDDGSSDPITSVSGINDAGEVDSSVSINLDFSNSNFDNSPILGNVPTLREYTNYTQSGYNGNAAVSNNEATPANSKTDAAPAMDHNIQAGGYANVTAGIDDNRLQISITNAEEVMDMVPTKGEMKNTELGIVLDRGETNFSGRANMQAKREIKPTFFADKESIKYKTTDANGNTDDHSGIIEETTLHEATIGFNADTDDDNARYKYDQMITYRGGSDSDTSLGVGKKSDFYAKIRDKWDKFATSDMRNIRDKNQASEKGCGFLAIIKSPAAAINGDNLMYSIPMQFNPEITGESRSANWSQHTAIGRTNEHFIWSNTAARTVQFKTSYAVIAPGDDDPDWFKDDDNTNIIYNGNQWGDFWTEDNISDILTKFKGLLLPEGYSDADIDTNRLDGNRLSPPIITIFFGDQSMTLWSDTAGGDKTYATWIATDLNLDPRLEVGYTNRRNPRMYDITMTLKEVAPSWQSYQSHAELGL